MFPSWDEIQKAAYDRWEQRGRMHGHDRDDWVAAELDLTFDMNFRTLLEYALAEKVDRVIGAAPSPRCRFCEQSPPRAAFSSVRPAIPEFVGNRTLKTRELCDECADQFSGAIDREFATFWQSLGSLRSAEAWLRDSPVPTAIPIGAYKALIRMALSIIPEADLAGFTDTIEWVGNPDQDFDSNLFGGLGCLVYQVHIPYPRPWTALARRIEEQAPFPHMLFFLASERLVLQTHLPLSSYDEDLDGTEVRIPERSFSTGLGSDLRAGMCLALPIRSSDPPKPRRIRLFA
jgi:hypothetical protein